MVALKKINSLFFIACVFSVGLFNEYLSCAASAVLIIRLIYITVKKKSFSFNCNPVTAAVALTVLFYLISPFWAVDGGMAFIGFLKYLPLLIFMLVIGQDEEKEDITELLPVAAVFMTAVSSALSFIPSASGYFTVAGRLSGFFQYSNTYAVFVLLSLTALISKGIKKWYEWAFAAVMLFGIFYSGSRTVFIIMLISLPITVIFTRNKRFILSFFGFLIIGVSTVVIYTVLSGNFDSIGRFLTVSLKESTFLGRLLYYKDALPVILKNPFGLGFMGYYYTQQSFQTGVYSVMYVHNDFLQLALDIGWIPASAVVFALVWSLFKKKTDAFRRIMLLTLAAHSCLEFNFAFVAIFMLFIALLDTESGKRITVSRIAPAASAASVMAVLCLYFSVAQFLSYIKKDEAALKLYPLNTVSKIRLLTETEDIEEMKDIALNITENNEYVSVAYSAIARYYYSRGDFEKVMKYKNLTFEYAPYQTEEYREYCYMLIVGIRLYENAGDTASADCCRYELLKIPNMLEALNEKTSDIGFMIDDKPDFSLGEEINKYISNIEIAG